MKSGFAMRYTGQLFGSVERRHSAAGFVGAGIGLPNIRRVRSCHGGGTEAGSELHHGRTVYFSLPRA